MQGGVSILFGLGWYLAWWYRHDRGIQLGGWDRLTAPAGISRLIRRGDGPILVTSLVMQIWAALVLLAGVLRAAFGGSWTSTVEQLAWVGGAVLAVATWGFVGILLARKSRV